MFYFKVFFIVLFLHSLSTVLDNVVILPEGDSGSVILHYDVYRFLKSLNLSREDNLRFKRMNRKQRLSFLNKRLFGVIGLLKSHNFYCGFFFICITLDYFIKYIVTQGEFFSPFNLFSFFFFSMIFIISLENSYRLNKFLDFYEVLEVKENGEFNLEANGMLEKDQVL